MARGNIEAMMVCEQYGYSVDDYGNLNSNDPVFAKCVASDNSSNNVLYKCFYEDIQNETNNDE